MAEYSGSGIADLPPVTAEMLQFGDSRVLGWLREAIQEGDRLNQSDPSYDKFEQGLRYVGGEQRLDPSADRIPYLPRIQINQTRKAVQAHTSALTDIKPLFGYKTPNKAYEFQSHLLNQLTVAWWVNTMADLELGNCVKYALAGGTGDLKVEWDPSAGLGGNHALIASDPRDTLAVRPSQQRNLQLWQGVVLREEHTVNVLRNLFPAKAYLFKDSPDSLLDTLKGRFRRVVTAIISPAADTLSGLNRATHSSKARSGQTLLYRCYLNDQTRNLTNKPVTMGDPNSNWAYVVQPGDYLYPRKRLIVATPDAIISDGPNPYWHGMFPVTRLKLWELPWHFLGLSILHDLFPIQDAINETANDIKLGLKQHMEPQIAFDRTAVSEATMKLYDPRKPGARIKLNPTAGEGFKKLEGPPPQVLQLGHELLQSLIGTFQDLAGVANLQQLLELRQLPSGDTLRQYYEALTPELRQEGRMLEAFLRDVGEMTKVNTFQFMSAKKRVMLLGDAGLALNDFDYDPDTLVPALTPEDPGYTKELDKALPRDRRAQFFHQQFIFTVAPNSILAMHAQEEKMTRLQLARMGYYDFWSLHESLETPNVGTPPPMPLPPLQPPTEADMPEIMQDLMNQALMQAMSMGGGMLPPGMEGLLGPGGQAPPSPDGGPPPPDDDTGAGGVAGEPGAPGGQPPMGPSGMSLKPPRWVLGPMGELLEIRVPMTVTERLQAQQLLGIGMTENPAGRKASGGSAPKQETKKDETGAPRSTVTESAGSKNA